MQNRDYGRRSTYPREDDRDRPRTIITRSAMELSTWKTDYEASAKFRRSEYAKLGIHENVMLEKLNAELVYLKESPEF